MASNSMSEHEWGRRMARLVFIWLGVSLVAIILLLTVIKDFFL